MKSEIPKPKSKSAYLVLRWSVAQRMRSVTHWVHAYTLQREEKSHTASVYNAKHLIVHYMNEIYFVITFSW